jgi:hypothetical protein
VTPHRIYLLADKQLTCFVQYSDWKEVRTIVQFRVGELADSRKIGEGDATLVDLQLF